MATKTEQLQIRLTTRQKAALKRLARDAGRDVSSYVLARLLPSPDARFADLVRALHEAAEPSYVLAELNDFLTACPPIEFAASLATANLVGLSPFLKNYVAAMVERAAHLKAIRAPDWVRDVEPLGEPHFATPLKGLRMHLLASAPVPFKRRNLFVDASVGDRA